MPIAEAQPIGKKSDCLTIPDADLFAKMEREQPNEDRRTGQNIDNANKKPISRKLILPDADSCEAMKKASTLFDANDYWRSFHGLGVNVAVVDTGIALLDGQPHPAFPIQSIRRAVGIDQDGNFALAYDRDSARKSARGKEPDWTLVQDRNGHGTHCAGVIAAHPLFKNSETGKIEAYGPKPGLTESDNGTYQSILDRWHPANQLSDAIKEYRDDPSKFIVQAGTALEGRSLADSVAPFSGVAPLVNLLIYKVSIGKNEAEGVQGEAPIGNIMRAIYDAIEHDADIISLSVSAPSSSDALYGAIHKALEARRIVICAAGNGGSRRRRNIGYPARYGGVLTIASHDRFGRPSPFSSTGGEIDFAGPGEDVWSTWLDGYAKRSGTSAATPWVVGLSALLLSKHREFNKIKKVKNNHFFSNGSQLRNNDEMREHLMRMATHPGRFDPLDGYGPLWPGDYHERGFLVN